jgi:hypothetical protein
VKKAHYGDFPENVAGMGREGKPYVTAAEYAARLWPNQTNGEIKVKYSVLILISYFIRM